MLCGPYWVGWMYGLSGSVCQEGGRVVWGEGLGAEGDEVGVEGGGEGVDGFGGGEGCWQRAAVLAPGAAWRTGMRWARLATQALRRAAVAAVGRRMVSAKVERSRRRPAARGSRQGRGMRMLARARAGRTVAEGRPESEMGGLARGRGSRSSRNCFAMGDWEAADGGGGNGGQGAGEVAAVEDGAAGAVDGAEEGGFGYSASCTNAGD